MVDKTPVELLSPEPRYRDFYNTILMWQIPSTPFDLPRLRSAQVAQGKPLGGRPSICLDTSRRGSRWPTIRIRYSTSPGAATRGMPLTWDSYINSRIFEADN